MIMEERREYRWMLGEDKQIAEIDSYEKLASQHLVEECMIAANKCAAAHLFAAIMHSSTRCCDASFS